MSPKKKQRPKAAQQLIDSLLDERNSAARTDPKARRFPTKLESNELSFENPNQIRIVDQAEPINDPLSSKKLENTLSIVPSNVPANASNTLSVEDEPPTSFLISIDDDFKAHDAVDEHEDFNGELSGKFGFEEKSVAASDSDDSNVSVLDDHTIRSPLLNPEALPMDAQAAVATKGQEPGEALFSRSSIDRFMPTEVKQHPGFGQGSNKPLLPEMSPASLGASSEVALRQSESLRIAQSRLTELENEIERLRRENEQLATAGETLRRRNDELLSKTESIDGQFRESLKTFDEERKVLRGQIQGKDRESHEVRVRLEEAEMRLESNFKKIRVRERELEHRLEIVKMETTTLVSTKDKMILDLKRQVDQLLHENEFGKQKTQEMFGQFKEKQDTIRRVVRALRIALTILEGDEEGPPVPVKKAE
jgi:hypothetical protein